MLKSNFVVSTKVNAYEVVQYIQPLQFLITWKKDPQTRRNHMYLRNNYLYNSTYFLLHCWISDTFDIPMNHLLVKRDGWMVVTSLHSCIDRACILVLYHYITKESVYEIDIIDNESEELETLSFNSDVFPPRNFEC